MVYRSPGKFRNHTLRRSMLSIHTGRQNNFITNIGVGHSTHIYMQCSAYIHTHPVISSQLLLSQQYIEAVTLYQPMTHIRMHRQTFSFIILYPAMSLGDVWEEMLEQGEVGGCTQSVQTACRVWAWSCLGLVMKSPWIEPGGPFLLF